MRAEQEFQTVGNCAALSDVFSCTGGRIDECVSCFTDISVQVDGVRQEPTGFGSYEPWTQYYEPFAAGALELVLVGCGRDETRVSLDGPAFVQPSVTATFVDGVPTVSWTTELPAASALVTLYGGVSGETCHLSGVDRHQFTQWTHARNATEYT
jgi:hypothetical protein